MKNFAVILILLLSSQLLNAQSETTKALATRFHDHSSSFYFYQNTLRMLNQNDSKEFDELIRNIEKMRFLMVNKTDDNFKENEYKKILDQYKTESFESMMTGRMGGRNFDIYMKDEKGSPLGTVILLNDSSRLYVLDIIGSVDLSKASQLFQTISSSPDIDKRIKAITNFQSKPKDNKIKVE